VLGFVYDGLEQVSCNSKEERGKRVTLSDSSFTFEDFAWNTIKENIRGARTKEHFNPLYPLFRETFMF
jgi:hypothetical protein